MNPHAILYPVFAQAFLTFGIGIWLVYLRVAAVKRGHLKASYYKLNRGGERPDYLVKVNNNYDNLLALPTLFYVVVILLLVTGRVDTMHIGLAWLFVGSRYAHSYIHTTSNRLRYRAWIFFFNTAVLVAMWMHFLVQVLRAW